MIDQRALDAAVEAYVQKIFGTSPSGLMPEQHELIDKGVRSAIEAYEAAKQNAVCCPSPGPPAAENKSEAK